MAYDQGYYQSAQRPYNGRAAQRPGPPQGYNQSPQQNYPPQQYDQYADDGYGYDNYDGGYGQGYDEGYADPYAGGRGNGYPQQNQPPSRGPPPQRDYPPQQEYYANGRGGAYPPRGGGRGGPPPMQRPPPEGQRGGYDQRGGGPGRGFANGAPAGRGFPNGGPVANGGPVGRGGRPAPLDRNGSSDPNVRGPPGPGGQLPRKPLKTPPISPDTVSWDTPFPTFPGAKKKTSISEEQEILQKMNNMDIGQGRPRTAGSKGSQDKYPRNAPTDDYGRPSMERRPTDERRAVDDYGRGSPDSQRNPRGPPQGPPQQGYQDPRRGPPPQNFGPPVRTNTYQEPGFNDRGDSQTPISPMRANFGPPSRSMTMPNEAPIAMNQRPPMPMPMDAGPSAPYNGPVGRGRGLPARPSTASSSRPPPQRTYPPPDPPMDDYANGGGFPNHDRGESVSDLYDDYYNAPDHYSRAHSNESEMPNFDVVAMNTGSGKRGASIDQHIQPGAYQQPQPMNSQQGFGGRGQPQAASFEMDGDAPRQNGYPNQRYDDGFGQYNPREQRGPPPQGYDDYDNRPPPPNTFIPPRPASAASRPNPGLSGLPSGPKPGYSNGPPPNGETDRNSFPGQTPPGGQGLPSHPPPVRAGLIPNSVAAQANNKPPPVRNYNNISPAQQPGPSPSPSASSIAPSQAPVTTAELEQLRLTVRNNPNDQVSAMLLVKRLVEASEVLVPAIPDQRARNKAREKYIMDAHKILKKLVATQHTEAMFYLADCYGRGALGLETDPKEAFTLYQSAAKAGHSGAAYRTAVCCELGSDDGGGTRKDPLKAIQWYKRAAMLGDTPAMYKMGMIQLKGLLGQPKNPREAVGWLKRAAERADIENPHALHELGLLYEAPQTPDGSLVRDEAYSFKLFQQAADLGYKFSQFRLGCAYEYGLFNCPIDPRTSIAWYSKAAQQEEHQSELALSGWYLTGSEGVLQQSDTEAYLWARKAAMAGLAKAEYAMGYFTEVGIGSPANLEDAKRWYWRAAAQNFPKARERLEDLKRGGSKAGLKVRERISRSKVGKQNEGECAVM